MSAKAKLSLIRAMIKEFWDGDSEDAFQILNSISVVLDFGEEKDA